MIAPLLASIIIHTRPVAPNAALKLHIYHSMKPSASFISVAWQPSPRRDNMDHEYMYKDLWLTSVLYAGLVGLAILGLRDWQRAARTAQTAACTTLRSGSPAI